MNTPLRVGMAAIIGLLLLGAGIYLFGARSGPGIGGQQATPTPAPTVSPSPALPTPTATPQPTPVDTTAGFRSSPFDLATRSRTRRPPWGRRTIPSTVRAARRRARRRARSMAYGTGRPRSTSTTGRHPPPTGSSWVRTTIRSPCLGSHRLSRQGRRRTLVPSCLPTVRHPHRTASGHGRRSSGNDLPRMWFVCRGGRRRRSRVCLRRVARRLHRAVEGVPEHGAIHARHPIAVRQRGAVGSIRAVAAATDHPPGGIRPAGPLRIGPSVCCRGPHNVP